MEAVLIENVKILLVVEIQMDHLSPQIKKETRAERYKNKIC